MTKLGSLPCCCSPRLMASPSGPPSRPPGTCVPSAAPHEVKRAAAMRESSSWAVQQQPRLITAADTTVDTLRYSTAITRPGMRRAHCVVAGAVCAAGLLVAAGCLGGGRIPQLPSSSVSAVRSNVMTEWLRAGSAEGRGKSAARSHTLLAHSRWVSTMMYNKSRSTEIQRGRPAVDFNQRPLISTCACVHALSHALESLPLANLLEALSPRVGLLMLHKLESGAGVIRIITTV